MLKKDLRFHSRNGVKAVLFKGSHKSVGPFKVTVLPVRKKSDNPSFAVVVSKKVAKTAVSRNRIRRRVFEAARKNWPTLQNTDTSLQIIVVCYREDIATMDWDLLQADLLAATKHAAERLKPKKSSKTSIS